MQRHPKRHPTSFNVIQRHPSCNVIQNFTQHHPKRHSTSSTASSNIIQRHPERHPGVIQNVNQNHPTPSKISPDLIQNITQRHPKYHPTSSTTSPNVNQGSSKTSSIVIRHPTSNKMLSIVIQRYPKRNQPHQQRHPPSSKMSSFIQNNIQRQSKRHPS